MWIYLLADGGSALMFAERDLPLVNLFIGLFEALVILAIFRVKKIVLFPAVILANFASMIVGGLILRISSDKVTNWIGGPLPVYHV